MTNKLTKEYILSREIECHKGRTYIFMKWKRKYWISLERQHPVTETTWGQISKQFFELHKPQLSYATKKPKCEFYVPTVTL